MINKVKIVSIVSGGLLASAVVVTTIVKIVKTN